MTGQSVWLGPLRKPVQAIMIACVAVTLALAAWFIFGSLTGISDVGMNEMLRPGDRMDVRLLLVALAGALLSAAIFLSDTVGAIEEPPHGFLDKLSLVISRLAMIGVIAIVVVMIYEVVSRYFFSKPTRWANELSLWIAGFVFLFAGQYAMQQRSHIRIYVIYNLMPRWLKKLSDCISVALIWAFAICLIWGGYNEAKTKLLRMETFGTAWDPPLPATIKPAILLIIALVAIQALSNLIADWNRDDDHHSPMDDVDQSEIENIRRTLQEPKHG